MKLFTCDHYPSPAMACEYGCHDMIWYRPSAGAFLMNALVEDWANNEKLDPFHSKLLPWQDPDTGEWYHFDGLDDVVNEIISRPSLLDEGDGWCNA